MKFNLFATQKKGEASAKLIIAVIAPTAIVPLFNSTAFTCVAGNCSVPTGTPAWVPTILGAMGVVALIFVMLKLVD